MVTLMLPGAGRLALGRRSCAGANTSSARLSSQTAMDITFKQLEIFRWVVVAGSITKASHRIGLSQPSISQQLAKLEETLDVQLIVRNRTGMVSMTPAGEFWFKVSEDILGRMSVAMNDHEKRFKHSSVVLRLGATPVLRGRFTAAAARIAQARLASSNSSWSMIPTRPIWSSNCGCIRSTSP